MIRDSIFSIHYSKASHVYAVRRMKLFNYLKVKGSNNLMCIKENKYEKGGSYEK